MRIFQYQGLTEPVLATAEPVTESRWHQPWSEPVRQRINPVLAIALAASGLFFSPQQAGEATSLDKWYSPLSEPVRIKPGLPSGEQQIIAFDPLPRVSFAWFNELSKPQKLERIGLAPAYQQTLAFYPLPYVSFGWFDWLSDPVRIKPGLSTPLQQFFATDTSVIPLTKLMEWFAAFSEPVRFKLALGPWMQQFYTAPTRLLPTPTITGSMTALETKDRFLAGAAAWNRVISGEVGVIQNNFTGAEIGVVEQRPSTGTSGIIIPAIAPASGAAVPAITSAHVSIRIV